MKEERGRNKTNETNKRKRRLEVEGGIEDK
jgi:hypothetical protein